MKAMIYYSELKRLIDATKDFVSHNGSKPVHTYIRLEFFKESLAVRASAVDGYMLSTEWGSCGDVNEEFRDDFAVLIKPTLLAQVGKCEYIIFSCDKNEVTVHASNGLKLTYGTPDPASFLNVDAAIPTDAPEQKIGFNGKRIMTMLKAACVNRPVDRPVIFNFHGPLRPVVIRTKDDFGRDNVKMLLPVRLKAED